tara:strand:- start:5341 stop:6600 length:1260 start_codon:yes stop_codon:yes gene_type:complete
LLRIYERRRACQPETKLVEEDGMAQQDVMQPYKGPIFFSAGFRPLFLGATLFAGIALPLWIFFLQGLFVPAGETFEPIYWHAHEMIFGYLGAVMGGFALTAIAEWTKRPPISGWSLGLLVALWLAGRIAIALAATGTITTSIAADIDLLYLAVLAAMMAREIIAGKNRKNLIIVGLFTVFWASNLIFHVALAADTDPMTGLRLALVVAAVLISVIGGRVTPTFTRNWLTREAGAPFPSAFGWPDRTALALTAIAMLVWACFPRETMAGALLIAAGVMQTWRLLRWRGERTSAEPLVFILHVGYGWLAVALLALGGSVLLPQWVDGGAALHALTAGAIGVMTMGVMTRATLGHTGRKLAADGGTITIYVLINLGAGLRICAHALPMDYVSILALSGMLWSAGFLLFAVKYGRYLLTPRVA